MGHLNAIPEGIEILGRMTPAYGEILSPQALAFVAKLARKFEGRRRELLAARAKRQGEFATEMIDFFTAMRLRLSQSPVSGSPGGGLARLA